MQLSQFLEESGWSRSDISRKLGLNKSAISHWGDEVPEKWVPVLEGCLRHNVGAETPEFIQIAKDMQAAGVRDLVAEGVLRDPAEDEQKVAYRRWHIEGDKVFFNGSWFGHGSKWDFEYSPAKIRYIRRLIKESGVKGTVQTLEGLGSVQDGTFIPAHPREMVEDVNHDRVCPVIVDEMESRFEGGATVARRVDPWQL